MQHISILNVATLEHKPLITGYMESGHAGVEFAFVMKAFPDMQLHFATRVKDVEGEGNYLVQHNFISLKKDVMNWLTKTGRLPSFTTKEYLEEIEMLKKYRE